MEASSTNLVSAVNRILENIGERRTISLETPVSRKAVVALQDALIDINSANDWAWTMNYTTPSSWNVDRASAGSVLRIHDVQYGSTTTGYRSLSFIDPRDFDDTPNLIGIATYFTVETYNRIRVKPYPITSIEQAKYRLYVTEELPFPSTANSVFPLPERHMLLLYLKAQSILAQNHLDDASAMSLYQRQYEDLVMKMRNRERLTPAYGTTVFKQRGLRRGR